jgi:AraC-like DNA-binding protein
MGGLAACQMPPSPWSDVSRSRKLGQGLPARAGSNVAEVPTTKELLQAWPTLTAVRGVGHLYDLHAHHAIQLTLAIHGELRIKSSQQGQWTEAAGVLVDTDLPHALDAGGREVLFVFLDPESSLGVSMRAVLNRQLHLLDEQEARKWYASLKSAVASEQRTIQAEVGSPSGFHERPKPCHPSVRRVIQYLRSGGIENDVALKTLADVAELSRTRLVHVFSESVGVPIRPYILWLRLQLAAAALGKGASITEAAHASGFSDSAHLTRTFRRMFGTTPSDLLDSRFAPDA